MYDGRLPRSGAGSVILLLMVSFLVTACGGSKTAVVLVAPVFRSTPGTQAVEGSLYSYQALVDNSSATLSLSSAPVGATLSGSTIAWTPTAGQSRVANSFTLTATAAGGASATQSWTVTPAGTIRVSWVDTLWKEDGSTAARAFDWSSVSSYVAALVPQPDGSFQSLYGSVGASGGFEIPNVPAGYYWLRVGRRDTYWTSSSTFDMGSDIFSPATNTTAPVSSMTLSFNFTALDPAPASGLLQLDSPEAFWLHYFAVTKAGFTTSIGGLGVGGNLDPSLVKNAFVRQYEAASFGSVDGYVLGPELTLSNLSLTAGGTNAISGALDPPVPASIHLSVQGSAWAALFDHIAPAAPASIGGGFYLSVQPYIAASEPNVSSSTPMNLIWTKAYSVLPFEADTCSSSPPFATDVDGSVSYSDPFPAAWRRTFRVCQSASVVVPVPGASQTQSINLNMAQTTAVPTATVKPLLSGVRNPKINGADLFVAGTVNSTAVTLSWDPPAIGTPIGYEVAIMSPTSLPNGSASYFSATTLSTAKTLMTLPPNVLAAGRTYIFVITALADGVANMETSPHRSSLPVAKADVMSAAITTN